MPTFFYDATYIVFFRWLGLGIGQLRGAGMAASLSAVGLLVWSIRRAVRGGLYRPPEIALAWLGALSALVAVAAVLHLVTFPVAMSFGWFPFVRAAAVPAGLLLLLGVVSAVWGTAIMRRPERMDRFHGSARLLQYAVLALGITCVGLLSV